MITSGSSNMPGTSLCFFKIILKDVGSHTELMIPEKVLRVLGEDLKDSVSLNAPSGSQWLVNLKRHEGKVWLQNGWPEFANFYSIGFGYLLVFEYKGDAKFQVLIFHPSSLEIDYPLAASDRPSTSENERVIDSSSSGDVFRPYNSTEASTKLRQEKAKDQVNKDRALSLEKSFKSKNPFFVHLMKESHIVGGGWPNVYIPKNFKEAHNNWKDKDQVILQVEGESWVVYCNLNQQCNQCRISRGWTIFARDNSLGVGDVCLFELINRSKKLFQVFIYRAAKGPEFENLPRVRSKADKARVLESVNAFEPEQPHFSVEVKNSYLYGGSITVPVQFVHKHITKDNCDVILQLPDGRVWSVKCYIKEKCAKFSAGWKNFSKENNLAAGDFCGFELVNQRLLKVVIFRLKS
ncbi:B3 domain-containing transcription factor VRN1-like [Apium graveolens]|uniref:B3 domain-containing transcription factor VRN1-like n=1 Tax=Apium graveolens TaxID=4045 RepID=UPI003D7AC22F